MDNLSITIDEKEKDLESNLESDLQSKLEPYNHKEDLTNDDDMLWVEKYRPKKISDALFKKDHLNIIEKWINDFMNKKINYKNTLLLHGPPGTGKTTIAKLILLKYNFDPIEFNASDIRNQKLIQSKINEILGKTNIIHLMMKQPKKIGIIMDEIDGMSSGDRGGLSELIKIMFPKKSRSKNKKNQSHGTPFICISNNVSEKKFNDLKKNSIVLKVSEPSNMFLTKLTNKIFLQENIEHDIEAVNLIVKQSQGDYRRLVNLLQYIYSNNNNRDIEEIEDLAENFDKKNRNFTTYQGIEKLLNTYKDIDSVLRIYEIDKNIIGMLFYENFLTYIIKNRKNNNKEKLDNIAEIYNNYSESDIFDKQIYLNQQWDLYDTNGIFKCSAGSFIINNMKKYSCNKVTNINYSSLLNKTSLEYLNYKNISQLSDKLNAYDETNSFIYLSTIISDYLFSKKHMIKGIQLLVDYGIDVENIEKLIKITKSDYKDFLSLKKKKEIKNIYNNLSKIKTI